MKTRRALPAVTGTSRKTGFVLLSVLLLLAAHLPLNAAEAVDNDSQRQTRLEDFGRALFFDVNLSRNRNQSCATCHDPARAFVDWRAFVAPAGDFGGASAPASASATAAGVPGAASVGTEAHMLGDRNAPTVTYASRVPAFSLGADGDYAGGLFLDGRASTLEDQAAGPPLNPIEMALPDKAAVLARLLENPNYAHVLRTEFGDAALSDADTAYAAFTSALAAFERTELFAPFDSKYDRYLRGEYSPTEEETLGMTLFFSNQFANCNKCHQLNTLPESAFEPFSNFKYRNIGTPVNTALRAANGLGTDHVDQGLLDNPAVNDPAQAGRFRVPTLRNVALTAPYMHNGVFSDLRTVVLFYNKYLARGSKAQLNPETGAAWGAPEVAENIALEELASGRALDERSIDALVAFMRMLTDQRYEVLLDAAPDQAGISTAP